MKLPEKFDNLINTYKQLLQRCHDALDANTPQAERDALRKALAQHIAGGKAEGDSNKDSASRD